MPNAFKSGDVVQLKSGGPTMTVVGPTQNGRGLYCRWFPSNDVRPLSDDFSAEQLKLIEST